MTHPTNDDIRERFEWHQPTEAQRDQLLESHFLIMDVVDFLLTLPDSRDRALALTSLEDTRMRINKAIVLGAPMIPVSEAGHAFR